MKIYLFIIIATAATAISLTACDNKPGAGKETASEHVHEEGDDHNHKKGDDHDHEDKHTSEGEHADEILFTKEQAKAAGLEIQDVKSETFSEVIKTSGQIQAAQGDEATIVATSNGIVSFPNQSIIEGAAVSSGTTIVTISAKNLYEGDPTAKAKIAYETALKEFKRSESLVKDQIISAKEFDQTRMRFENAKTVYEAQAANVTSSGVRVNSPINGYVKSKLINQGEYVSVGQPVAIVSQNRKLQLRAEVAENYYSELKKINNANFALSYNNKVYKLSDLNGRLISFGKTSDNSSFYIPVIFEFDNIGDIIPGSYVEVYLLSVPQDNIISIPVSALAEEQGLYFVYLQIGEEEYTKREVILGQSNGERVKVISGIRNGDKIVTKGTYQVKLAATSSIIPEGHSH